MGCAPSQNVPLPDTIGPLWQDPCASIRRYEGDSSSPASSSSTFSCTIPVMTRTLDHPYGTPCTIRVKNTTRSNKDTGQYGGDDTFHKNLYHVEYTARGMILSVPNPDHPDPVPIAMIRNQYEILSYKPVFSGQISSTRYQGAELYSYATIQPVGTFTGFLTYVHHSKAFGSDVKLQAVPEDKKFATNLKEPQNLYHAIDVRNKDTKIAVWRKRSAQYELQLFMQDHALGICFVLIHIQMNMKVNKKNERARRN